MLPVIVRYDSRIDHLEESAIIAGMSVFQDAFPDRSVLLYGKDGPASDEDGWSSADHLIESASRLPSGDLDAYSLILLMMQEPLQQIERHIDVLVTSEEMSECYGVRKCPQRIPEKTCGRFTVISIRRFRELPRRERSLAIMSVIWHEMGHVLGMAGNINRLNTEGKTSPHCTAYSCAMRHASDLNGIVSRAERAEKRTVVYCSSCLEDAKRSLF